MSKIILTLYIFTTVFALVILKLGTQSGLPIAYIDNRISFNFTWQTITGILLYGVSFMTYVYLISKNDLGYIIPLAAGFVYLLIFIASYFVFNETFTFAKSIGIILIVAGLLVLNLKK